jgi:SAM-dependent methyltransferase
LIDPHAEKIRHERAASFGGVAGDYARSRPGYPDAAVRWLTEGSSDAALDVAAGTGKLTLQLRDYSRSVTALELSVPMLLELQALDQSIAAVSGRAEALPFQSDSFDLITVAQAFHWFDQRAAVAEFARVLRPGGRVAILWNFRDESVDWVAELSKLIGSEDSQDDEAFLDPLGSHDAFAPSVEGTFDFEQVLDRDLLAALVRSRSYVATLPDEDRRALLGRVMRLCDEHPSLSRHSRFSMRYRTKVYRAAKDG